MRKTVVIVSWSAQQWIDNFSPPLLLSRPLDNGLMARKTGCPLSASSNSLSAILSHCPCGLSSLIEYKIFSEPGPRNDHRPVQNHFAYRETRLAFARHSSSLPFLSQEMSLNIDLNRILHVKIPGVSPYFNSKLDFVSELQRLESWEYISLEVHRLTVDCVKVSVFRR